MLAGMPAGLDGHPDPLVTPERSRLLDEVAAAIVALRQGERAMVAVDGASGTGKSTMADELALRIEAAGRPVLRATVDSFHRPRAERVARGKDSATGYYLDSHQLAVLATRLLDPFAAGASTVCRGVFDEPADAPVENVVDGVGSDAVLLFDGLFLHRPELIGRWHLSLFLLADRRRREAWDGYWADKDPALAERRRHRYFDGQSLYEADADPRAHATFVIDNDDLSAPVLVRRVEGGHST